jgi:hypothetical protein
MGTLKPQQKPLVELPNYIIFKHFHVQFKKAPVEHHQPKAKAIWYFHLFFVI